MVFLRNLFKVELATIVCLFVYAMGCALVSAIFAPFPAVQAPTTPPSIGGAPAVMAVTFLFGFWPAVLFFAPIYTFLRIRRTVNFLIAVVIGMLPAVAFYMAAPTLGLFALLSGALVSAATHALMREPAHPAQ